MSGHVRVTSPLQWWNGSWRRRPAVTHTFSGEVSAGAGMLPW